MFSNPSALLLTIGMTCYSDIEQRVALFIFVFNIPNLLVFIGDADAEMNTSDAAATSSVDEACEQHPEQEAALTAPLDEDSANVLASVGIQVNTFQDSSLEGINIMHNLTSDKNLKVATGIDDLEIFRALVKCCMTRAKCRTADIERNIIITFMKLKHAMSFSLLAVLFRLSVPSISSIFADTVTMLGVILSAAISWPEKEEIMNNMPKCFAKFQKTRLIVDCTEVPIENAKCLCCRLKCYSHYKGQQTCKFLIGVSPAGLITAVSVPWGGRASDKVIFENMPVLNDLEPFADAVMADKGFHIEKALEERGIELYRPPFLRKSRQFSKADANSTVDIAAARVHVERVIGRVKAFKMLTQTLPWRMVPYLHDIIVVICGITNLARPVLSDDKFL